MEVFTLGGTRSSDDRAETAYYAVRAGLAQEVRAALKYLAREPAGRAGAPALMRFVQAVAQRFGVQVAEKAAAQAIPVLGALGGATINALFMEHFQDMAHGHFTVRRLERKYGPEAVRHEFQCCAADQRRQHDQ
jgi:hypothetical protein